MDIRGKRILLTGASGGLGTAIARELARRGGRLVLTARRRELLEGLAAEIDAEVVVADLADRGDVDELAGYLAYAPGLPYAHPTHEHFTPLFVTLGAAEGTVRTTVEGYAFGLSKRSFQI